MPMDRFSIAFFIISPYVSCIFDARSPVNGASLAPLGAQHEGPGFSHGVELALPEATCASQLHALGLG